jgi:Domain of unknown function (DUF2017)
VSGAAGRGEPDRDDPAGSAPGEGGTAGGAQDEEETTGAFRRSRGKVSARFTAAQAVILRNLVSQVAELMGDAEPGPRAGDPRTDDPRADHPQAGDPRAGDPGPAGRGEPALSPEDLAAMLGATGPTSPPEDPVLARLLPDAYRDDPEAAGEFRRYTEQDLRSGKVAATRTVLATLPTEGGHIRLGPEDAQAWLRALNDARLAIGTVLGITEDYEDELAAASWADPRSAYLEVYHWLGYIQDSLVRALW